jgi:hypothetical protein
MAGMIKQMINTIIDKRSKGNQTVATTTKTKLILKGLNPDRFDAVSPDDPIIIAKVRAVGVEMGVSV